MPLSKKIFYVILAMLIGFASISAYGFSAQVVASPQDKKMEWWFNQPANSAPHVIQISSVYFHQEFSLFSFFENASIKDGKFHIKYTITSTDPKGKKTIVAKDIVQKGSKASKSIIVASTEIVGACFDKNNPDGLYTFEISAKDEISGETSTSKTHLRVVDWNAPIPMNDKKEVVNAIFNFYKNPSPESLYMIFYSNELNLEQRGAPNDLNYIYAGFFRSAFMRNSFLTPFLRDKFPSMSPLDRAKTIYLFALMDEARIDFNILTESEKKYQDAMRKANIPAPYAKWDKILGAVQIDLLWGEFFADGTYKPIRRIMDLLAYTEEGNFTLRMLTEKRRPKNREEWEKMMMGAYHSAALNSILDYASQFELIRNYCRWAIQNKDIPESSFKLLGEISEKK